MNSPCWQSRWAGAEGCLARPDGSTAARLRRRRGVWRRERKLKTRTWREQGDAQSEQPGRRCGSLLISVELRRRTESVRTAGRGSPSTTSAEARMNWKRSTTEVEERSSPDPGLQSSAAMARATEAREKRSYVSTLEAGRASGRTNPSRVSPSSRSEPPMSRRRDGTERQRRSPSLACSPGSASSTAINRGGE